MVTNELKVASLVSVAADEIRHTLPGQRLQMGRSAIEVRYGLVYPVLELERRIRQTLPWRFGKSRHVWWYKVELYTGFIPDEALQRYAEARRHEIFVGFSILEAHYALQPQVRDPWLIGWIHHRWPSLEKQRDEEARGIVLAYWDNVTAAT